MKARNVWAVAALLALAGCGTSEAGDTTPAVADVPAYEVVSDVRRTVVVEVDTMPDSTGMRAIFEDVRTKRDDVAGGYFVEVNCSTGATKAAVNRLANGRFAVGDLGAAQTGLRDGESVFEPLAGRTCPAR